MHSIARAIRHAQLRSRTRPSKSPKGGLIGLANFTPALLLRKPCLPEERSGQSKASSTFAGRGCCSIAQGQRFSLRDCPISDGSLCKKQPSALSWIIRGVYSRGDRTKKGDEMGLAISDITTADMIFQLNSRFA